MPLKPLRREAGVFRLPLSFLACVRKVHFPLHARLRVRRAPGVSSPSGFLGGKEEQSQDASRRENANACREPVQCWNDA